MSISNMSGREEVIQYIYKKYGRERAGIAATIVHYRTRRAIREVGKVLGFSDEVVGALAGSVWGWKQRRCFRWQRSRSRFRSIG